MQKYIFAIEMAEANAPPIVPFGLSMVGPVIYTFGNEEQKKRFLPDILASKVWWCQGYSEPGAGSDLASLKMRRPLCREWHQDLDHARPARGLDIRSCANEH